MIGIGPVQGEEGTVITVVAKGLITHDHLKLAFNSHLIDTRHIHVQDFTSLVAAVPAFKHTHSTTSRVTISICFFEKNSVINTWPIANFYYQKQQATLPPLFTEETLWHGYHQAHAHGKNLAVLDKVLYTFD